MSCVRDRGRGREEKHFIVNPSARSLLAGRFNFVLLKWKDSLECEGT